VLCAAFVLFAMKMRCENEDAVVEAAAGSSSKQQAATRKQAEHKCRNGHSPSRTIFSRGEEDLLPWFAVLFIQKSGRESSNGWVGPLVKTGENVRLDTCATQKTSDARLEKFSNVFITVLRYIYQDSQRS